MLQEKQERVLHWEKANVQAERTKIRQFCLREVERVPQHTFDCFNIKYKLLNAKHKTFTVKPQHILTALAPSLWSQPSRPRPLLLLYPASSPLDLKWLLLPHLFTPNSWMPVLLWCLYKLRQVSHLFHYMQGFLVISLCVQVLHIGKLLEGRTQSYSFFFFFFL